MRCETIRTQLDPYLDDRVPPGARREVLNHVAGCEDCRTLTDDLERGRASVRLLRPVPAPESLMQEVRARLWIRGGSPTWVAAARPAVAAVLLFGLMSLGAALLVADLEPTSTAPEQARVPAPTPPASAPEARPSQAIAKADPSADSSPKTVRPPTKPAPPNSGPETAKTYGKMRGAKPAVRGLASGGATGGNAPSDPPHEKKDDQALKHQGQLDKSASGNGLGGRPARDPRRNRQFIQPRDGAAGQTVYTLELPTRRTEQMNQLVRRELQRLGLAQRHDHTSLHATRPEQTLHLSGLTQPELDGLRAALGALRRSELAGRLGELAEALSRAARESESGRRRKAGPTGPGPGDAKSSPADTAARRYRVKIRLTQ